MVAQAAMTREVLAVAALRVKYRNQQALKEADRPYPTPTLRGDALKLWGSEDGEVILSGPAETGKTWTCLHKLHRDMLQYPGAQAAIVRKTYQSMHGSVLQTYRRILGKDTPIHAFGGEKPEWFDYPNGSRVFVGGMDNPQKVLSSERDRIYVNQAEELELDDWETLTTRATGRGDGRMPYAQIYGDCNPGPATHWILGREPLRLFHSRHEDNPTLFDDEGRITEQGKRTMQVLDALTGTRLQRLRHGKWVGAEGVVYEEWDRSIHLMDPFLIPDEWARYRVIDFGFTNPFVCQWWAEDPEGRVYLYREFYMTGRLVDDWATDINEHSRGEQYQYSLADHDAEGRATLDARGISTQAAQKDVSDGIQAVKARLKVQPHDGKPRLFVFKNCRVNDPDPALMEKHKPLSTAEEFDGYVWAKVQRTDRLKEEPLKKDDHGMDAMRYFVYYLDIMGNSPGVFFVP
jgi:PBSX family phage terminase large subunit